MSITQVFAAAAETAPAQVIPTINILYAAATAVLLVGAAIAGFMILRKHASNWGNSMVYGLLAGIAFIALVPMLISALVSIVPSWADYLTKNETANQIVSVALQFIVTCLAFTVGMILLKRSSEKTHQKIDIGSGIMFGFAVFIVELFVGQQLSICVQYIPACISINQMGYEEAIKTVMESGLTEAEAVDYLKNLAQLGGLEFLYAGIAMILKGIVEVFAGALAYGLVTNKFPKQYYALLILGFFVVFAMDLLFYFINAKTLVHLAATAVFAALFAFASIRVIKQYVPDEWDQFREKKDGRTSGFPRKDRGPQKMPKITMPKE